MKRRRVALHPSGFPWVWMYDEHEYLYPPAPDASRSDKCTECREPSMWRHAGPKGWARHPNCGLSLLSYASPGLLMDTVYSLMAVFPEMTQVADPAEPDPVRAIGNPNAGCETCGRPYAALWVGARTWRCPAHPPETSRYNRGRSA